ncbi:OmpA/MotB family protein [Desulfofustis glycolicus]|uniref:Chemotaxis protein MotB n=1 Tax=Desulfofustis glycolicus DSM 9705 TaxID=1121409 RepID=A0A1M5U1U9_9BACT|nr:flagellar motor protein MotB [Desulfofustis glycolicus]MCB2214709.1 flagellar motor protein MotB [Desulfobulbaceae bacterium]SHH56831.1 chemotaxis protein MotB [Desulfofustis glycolicus DSM 9705]
MAEESTANQQSPRKKKKAESPGVPAWMVTYSDLVTLLLTFFVLLLSMANLDPVRFTRASGSLKEAFGVHPRPAQVEFAIPILPSPPKTKFTPVQIELTRKIHQRLKAQIVEMELGKDVDAVQQDAETIILRVNNAVLFNPGDHRLNPPAYPTLRHLADLIRPLPVTLRIEGHTDDLPIKSEIFADNWELSIARAVSVARFFEQGDLLPLDRISAIGYGADRPLVPNISEANRAVNRRVDFVLRVKNLSGTTPAENSSESVPL